MFTVNSKEELIKILERELGKPVLPPETSYQLSSWLDTWINLFIKDFFRYSTIASNQRTINNKIKPELGEIALKDLDEYKISSFYKKLDMQGASNIIKNNQFCFFQIIIYIFIGGLFYRSICYRFFF